MAMEAANIVATLIIATLSSGETFGFAGAIL